MQAFSKAQKVQYQKTDYPANLKSRLLLFSDDILYLVFE